VHKTPDPPMPTVRLHVVRGSRKKPLYIGKFDHNKTGSKFCGLIKTLIKWHHYL